MPGVTFSSAIYWEGFAEARAWADSRKQMMLLAGQLEEGSSRRREQHGQRL